MKKILIIIPAYKAEINQFEKDSLLQCRKIFNQYKIVFVAPTALDLSKYHIEKKNEIVKRFDASFFTSVQSYNKLLKSELFYSTFKKFEFLLIYQLDAFVFKDELCLWVNKGYDYIGAPWYSNFENATEISEIIGVGNGGFSLRNNHKAISILRRIRFLQLLNRYVFFGGIFNYLMEKQTTMQSKIIFFLFSVNKTPSYLNELLINSDANEDGYWSIWVASTFSDYFVAPVNDAIKFSFEVNPSLLFKLNNEILPFGCHAWRKYEYDIFWKKFIYP
jgi:hypothetical protein